DGLETWAEMFVSYLPKMIIAVILYFVGKRIVRWGTRITENLLKKKRFAPSLQTFLSSVVKISLVVLLALTIISVLGINITSFAAVMAGAGIALGSALNGTLGNLAGGVMILMLRPFRVGDLIEAQEQFGVVSEVEKPKKLPSR